jgi:hypothetical protein
MRRRDDEGCSQKRGDQGSTEYLPYVVTQNKNTGVGQAFATHKRYPLTVFLSIPVPRSAGQPSFVFVAINEVRRYFVTSVLADLSLGLKTLGPKTDYSCASSAEVNNLLNYSAMSSFHGVELR